MNFTTAQNIYSVSRLNHTVKDLLQTHFLQIWVQGEVSNLIKASSGHWYFKLKDDRAQVQTAMFKGNNRHVRFNVENGQQVLVKARVSLYEPRGDYQLIVEQMEADGEGLLKQQFEKLKFKLASEGLFAQESKKLLPKLINKVGVITSPTGAAIHDILSVLHKRAPSIEVIVYPSLVQGNEAAATISHMIEIANQRNEVDLLIVGRGGGSTEDLWSFNEEPVARAIFHSSLPIISAVGHEVDVTISDLVADHRAPTPSAAAEVISTTVVEYKNRIQLKQQRLAANIKQLIYGYHSKLNHIQQKLVKVDPKYRLYEQQQKLDEYQYRLNNAMTKLLNDKKTRHSKLQQALSVNSPEKKLANLKLKTQALQQRFYASAQTLTQPKLYRLAVLGEKLNAFSPLATLNRGYSIMLNDDKKVIKSTKQVNVNQSVTVKLQDGHVNCQVLGVNKD
ncbi:exodeoxyribonuclease VII large subunit [Saccharobesus litoralis]|uniref:Exodeoxyribonuclease 7 large subunit n=1 Tax=Saccharobesus litoralis TaxID=2172099 RepID=A0A2S0VTW7_9ALTE|nr:exodeoxyribonuclease VII large subunit [Saccharobesus litoralis]AWB67633.1 exodeoxyribonuclease VII large subunit [Saccharobesus litoralis]